MPTLAAAQFGALFENGGWVRSRREDRPVDHTGSPLPWVTYPAIHLLSDRTPKDVRVFEYGAGSSTLWWEARGATVVSCEHDVRWHEAISRQVNTAVVTFKALDDGYIDEPTNYQTYPIVIDGRRRVDCARVAARCLTDRGVIVWDNTDRSKYEPGLKFLLDSGFRGVDLRGAVPGPLQSSVTSIFYRSNNCLAL